MGDWTLVSHGHPAGHDSRSYRTEAAARAMAEWLARLRRYSGHVLVGPLGEALRLGPDGLDARPPGPSEQAELGLPPADDSHAESRLAKRRGD